MPPSRLTPESWETAVELRAVVVVRDRVAADRDEIAIGVRARPRRSALCRGGAGDDDLHRDGARRRRRRARRAARRCRSEHRAEHGDAASEEPSAQGCEGSDSPSDRVERPGTATSAPRIPARSGGMEQNGQAIEALLDEQRLFEPPAAFRAAARVARRRRLRRGRCRPCGVVEGARARGARVVRAADAGTRRLEPALLQVVRGRRPERLGQLPRPPPRGGRRREGGLRVGRRAGRRRAHDQLPAAARRGQPLRERPQGPRRAARRPRRDLPGHGPGAAGRDARVRSHRRGALRRLRRLLVDVARGTHRRCRVQGADHRGRRLAQGLDRAAQGQRRRRARAELVGRARRRRAPHRPRRVLAPRAATTGTTS